MFVKCLGSGDAFASGGRLNSSFFIRTRTLGVLLDCGASALIALKKARLSANDVDVILISHLHGDHFGGLAFLLCEIIATGKRTKPLTIIGPEGTREKTLVILDALFPGTELAPDAPVRFIHFTTEEVLAFETLQLTAFAAVHSPLTNPHSLRIVADGAIIGYSGDTEWSDTLLRVSMNADLFICEASSWNTTIRYHLSVKGLLAQLHRIQAKRIVLTHLGEETLKKIDHVPFTFAEDGMVLMDDS